MDAIIQHISTIATLYFTQVINTNNRSLDNAIITIISIFIVYFVKTIFENFRQIYNCIVFHLYRMHNNPIEIWKAPYLRPYSSTTAEMKQFNRHHWMIPLIKSISEEDIKYLQLNLGLIISELIRDSGVAWLRDNDMSGATFIFDKGQESKFCSNLFTHFPGLYLIAFDYYGNPIYFGTDGYYCYKDLNWFLYFRNHIIQFIKDKLYTIKNNSSINGIYSVKDKKNVKIGEISQKKTFDTLFYTQKKDLLNLLHSFKENKLYPSHIPMDNKLGILLYGPPGTGKTGTISAIANYLQRNITIINFAEITTINELNDVLTSNKYKETIFVFDEFDCILDAIGNNSNGEDKKDWGTMLLAAEGEERKQIIEMMKTGKKVPTLNIGYLLQKLDGLESAEGRVIVATTNNPDKINPALLRPGRFDLKLCLSNCTKDMYCDILENYYTEEKDVVKKVRQANIREFRFSPLELLNMAMQNNKLDELLKYIREIQ